MSLHHVPQTVLTAPRSICAYNSLRPLQITKESLSIITTHHNIDAQLDGILLAFGDKPRNSEAGMGITDIQYGPGGTYGKRYLWYISQSLRAS